MTDTRPPLPPFTSDTAAQKVRLAEDAWNTRDPQKVSLAYTPDSKWRNRAEFVTGRGEIVHFLERKWARELGYRLINDLPISESQRLYHWPLGPRPDGHQGLSELGL
jgi:nuclear transport factor 2 (NTF2) superfamily protein